MDYTMKFQILMASQMKYFSVIISLLIKHAYGVFPMKWIYFTEIQIIESILCMLQMFISHINRIKSKLLIKTEKDKSSLILRDRRNVKNFKNSRPNFFPFSFQFFSEWYSNEPSSFNLRQEHQGYVVLITQLVTLSLFH